MIETVFNLFKIHRKMIFGNPAIIVQNMLRKAPKTLNTVDMILGFLADQCFRVVDGEMLPQPLQGVVASEGVGVVDRSLPGFLADDRHQLFFGNVLHYARIDLAIALQEAKDNVFAGSATSAPALASAAKVAFIHLHLAVQFAALKLRHVVDRFAEMLIDAGDGLIVKAKVMREAIGRLLLVESLDNGNLRPHPFQRLLFSTGLVATPDVSSIRLRDLERTAENTLFAPQKVGRAPENVLFSCNHKGILAPRGYETH